MLPQVWPQSALGAELIGEECVMGNAFGAPDADLDAVHLETESLKAAWASLCGTPTDTNHSLCHACLGDFRDWHNAHAMPLIQELRANYEDRTVCCLPKCQHFI